MSSYQTGKTAEQASLVASVKAPPPPKMRPMSQLDKRRKRHMCCAMTLVTIFVGGTIGLFAWVLKRNESNPNFVNVVTLAQLAQDTLNKHMNKQLEKVSPGCEATVLVMRHCEKKGILHVDADGNQHCSYLGMERAYWLPSIFGTRWPVPSYLFVMSVSRDGHFNFREYETLKPLADQFGVDITVAGSHEMKPRIFELLQTGALCGKIAVISMKHEYIPKLAPALGCGPVEGCPTFYSGTSFDEVWQIKYAFRPLGFEYKEDEKNFVPADDNDDDSVNPPSDTADPKKRQLKKKAAHSGEVNGWQVYGSVAYQGFDPLSQSYAAGDYPLGGVPTAGRWKPVEQEVQDSTPAVDTTGDSL
jgi:hypothetical protein